MTGFYYVYMLSDVATHTHHYIGMTGNLQARLEKHDSGQVPHALKFAPWTIDAAIAVCGKTIAAQLERYLKSGSGRAFANKHLFPHVYDAMKHVTSDFPALGCGILL